jgi:ferric iron reductase protein FhuF
LGIAARLWSVALGTVALGGCVPDLHPDRVHWRLPAQGGPLDLWVPRLDPVGDGDGRGLHEAVMVENLAPLTAAVLAVAPVAERLLWGNAASALAGALRVLHGQVGAERPEGYRAAETAARELLGRTPLLGTGHLSATAPPSFRRSTCCLYYRLPSGGLCGDCVFTTPPCPRHHRIVN